MLEGPKILVKEGAITNSIRKGDPPRIVLQVVIPKILRNLCMDIMHNGFGHPGASRCLVTARLRYTWSTMRKDIIAHVADCRQCQNVVYHWIGFIWI